MATTDNGLKMEKSTLLNPEATTTSDAVEINEAIEWCPQHCTVVQIQSEMFMILGGSKFDGTR